MKIERVSNIDPEVFQEYYMIGNKPVIIIDAMNTWEAKTLWTPKYLIDKFGDKEVQIYDDLFKLTDIITLREYIEKYFYKESIKGHDAVPYVRWYSQLKNFNFPWSDDFFEKVTEHWEMPYFLPSSSYLLPFCPPNKVISPNIDKFPAKGLFISAKGAKTRLHFDPWCSDAILCQIYGEKDIILYSPEQSKNLYDGTDVINLDNPDLNRFNTYQDAKPSYIDRLKPGEVIFFPRGWFHHVDTVSDSISLTWNFAHVSTWDKVFEYIISLPSTEEIELMRFFIKV